MALVRHAVLASFLFLCTQANAFDIDGFYNGMTRQDVIERLTALGIAPKPNLLDQAHHVDGGVYDIAFCNNGTVAAVTKKVGVKEFNSYLIDMVRNHGQPAVDISSPDLDILYLRWKLADGSDFSLNSGFGSDGRFHNVGAIDNSLCKN